MLSIKTFRATLAPQEALKVKIPAPALACALVSGNQFAVTSIIHQEIDDELKAFAAEYYKENP
jgi:hypothetical protein